LGKCLDQQIVDFQMYISTTKQAICLSTSEVGVVH
jgi:hypothetical protein